MIGLSIVVALTIGSSFQNYRTQYPLPSVTPPQGWGVNIHFTDPAPGEMEKIRSAGFKWIRMDFGWSGVERAKGQYDFAPYDRLMASLKSVGMRPIIILDYGNDLYQKGSPRSPEAISAFCRFVEHAMTHFAGQGIVWEMWNEPNISFWQPKPNVDEYVALATEVGKTIRRVAPSEWFIGPGTSGLDWSFLETCFKAGMLKYWDAVSVHPYRGSEPETVINDWIRLRGLVDAYAPKSRRIGLISSEWGYANQDGGVSAEVQAAYAGRQYLANLVGGAPLSIWYDWKNDGQSRTDPECNFGTVKTDLTPKPAFLEIQRLSSELAGYEFMMRLTQESSKDFVLAFRRGQFVKYVAWTTSPASKSTLLRLGQDTRTLELTNDPAVWTAGHPNLTRDWPATPLAFPISDAGLTKAFVTEIVRQLDSVAAKYRLYPHMVLRDPSTGSAHEYRWKLANENAVADPLVTSLTRDWQAGSRLLDVTLTDQKGHEMTQSIQCSQSRRVSINEVVAGDDLWLVVVNSGSRQGQLVVKLLIGSQQKNLSIPLSGAMESVTPSDTGRFKGGPLGLQFAFTSNRSHSPNLAFSNGADRVAPVALDHYSVDGSMELDPKRYSLTPDGDPKVACSIGATTLVEKSGPVGDSEAIRIDYKFEQGWKFLTLLAQGELATRLFTNPISLNMFVKGNKSDDNFLMRFIDSTGQVFQPDYGKIDWDGWKFVSFPLTGEGDWHWGGANDGVVHYPIRLNALALVDPGGKAGNATSIELTGVTLVERLHP